MTHDIAQTDRYVSQHFVMQRFGVTDRTIRSWRTTPELNFPAPLFVGNKYRYLYSEIIAWEQANRAAPIQKAVA